MLSQVLPQAKSCAFGCETLNRASTGSAAADRDPRERKEKDWWGNRFGPSCLIFGTLRQGAAVFYVSKAGATGQIAPPLRIKYAE